MSKFYSNMKIHTRKIFSISLNIKGMQIKNSTEASPFTPIEWPYQKSKKQ